MTDQLPPPTDTPRPWWKRGWGIAYLTLLGIAAVATVILVAVPVPSGEAGLGTAIFKMIALGWAVGALDVLLAIAIAVGVFSFLRLREASAATWILGLILFVLSTAAVVIFFFFACMAVIRRI